MWKINILQEVFYEQILRVIILRNNEDIGWKIEKMFDPVMEYVRERMSAQFCDELDMLLTDCYGDAVTYAGVTGMELAIGVTNGTIQQTIE